VPVTDWGDRPGGALPGGFEMIGEGAEVRVLVRWMPGPGGGGGGSMDGGPGRD
jgi:hypothetical protein